MERLEGAIAWVAAIRSPSRSPMIPPVTTDNEVRLPSPWASVKHALPTVLEAVVGPLVVFYVFLVALSYQGAVLAAFVWALMAVLRRIARRERIPGTLVFGAALLGIRTALALATGSVFLYFAQPVAGTVTVAILFLLSSLTKRPLAERLAHDFCPLDPSLLRRTAVRRFFVQISLLWAIVLLANAGTVMWLLLSSPLRMFVLERTAVSWSLTGLGTILSVFWFVRVMKREGIVVRFGHKPAVATVKVPVRPASKP